MISAPKIQRRRGTTATYALPLLLSASAGAVILSEPVMAQASGVDALVKQAQYWRSKGREDLAQQALRRARSIDPSNPALKASAGLRPAPAKPAPAVRPAPAKAAVPQPRPAGRASAPASGGSNRAGQARVAGYDALNSGNLASAASQFQRALAANRNDPDALGGLGLVRLREGNFIEAADLLGQASRLGKADQWGRGLASARFFAELGDARNLLSLGRTADAQVKAEALVRSGYEDTRPAIELLGDVYEKQGRYADAADLYRQAGKGAGESDEKRLQLRAARGRALAAADRGDDLGATREFQSGLVLDPHDPWIRYEFAEYMIKLGRVPEAESLVQSLVSIGGPDATYAAALLNNDLKRPEAAERLIATIPETQRTAQMRNLAIGVKTDNAVARARVMAKSGQQAQALNALRQLGSMAAVPAGKQAAVANALYELGDTAGAVQVAQNALDQQITNLEDYEGLISVLARAGREDLAQGALQRAGQLAGSSADGQKAYARISASLMVSQADNARLSGRFAESFDILQSAYGAAPENPEILTGLARLYQSGGMPGKAAQTFQLVLARRPNDKDALVGLADAAQAAGDRELSQQAQRQVLQAYPEDYQVRLQLAQVERLRGNERAAMALLKDAREIYARGQASNAVAGANPFAGFSAPGGGGNPFRNQGPAVSAQVNPFSLGGGARLPASGYAAPQSYGTPQNYAATGDAYGQAAFSPVLQQSYAAPIGGGAPSSFTSSATASAQSHGGDPVMSQIQSEIADLAQDSGPRVDVRTDYRARSGETGLSKLNEIKGSAKISTGMLSGRVYGKVEATVADSGRPTGSGLARFGRNPTPEAYAIVNEAEAELAAADTQQASGVAFSVGYESDAVQLEAGTTPLGMGKTKFAGRAGVSPKVGENTRISAFVEHKPVTDSVLSYAGARVTTLDPVTGEAEQGQRWGQVMRTAGGLGLSYDRDGSGVYAEGRYYRLRGENVRRNHGIEANIGGYLSAYRDQHSNVSVGLNVNYQAYDNSQNYFTFGNGGYFSPQSFISVGFPLTYNFEDERIETHANFTPGFQSYKQDATNIYPTDDAAQGELNYLKTQNNDVRSYFDSISQTGFAMAAGGSLYYRVGGATRIGGEANYSTFGSYNEFRSMLGVRQSLGSSK